MALAERIMRELVMQDYWHEADWPEVLPEQIDHYLAIDGVRARYQRKAERLALLAVAV